MEEENKKLSNFKKLMPFTHPKFLIIFGPITAAVVGCAMPFMGLVLSHMLGYLVTPIEYLQSDDGSLKGKEYLKREVNFFSLMLLVTAVSTSTFKYFQVSSFRKIGSNVTLGVR